MGCKDSFDNTCMDRTNARCVDYEGVIPEWCDECLKCASVEDIIECIIDKVGDIDFSDFDSCIEVEATDAKKGITIKDILTAYSEKICSLEDKCKDCSSSGGSCANKTDECGNVIDCCDIFKKKSFFISNDGETINSKIYASFPDTTSDFKYKADSKGKYKILVEVDVISGELGYGVSINSTSVATDPFSNSESSSYKTVAFIADLNKDDILELLFKGSAITTVSLIKMIIEKIG